MATLTHKSGRCVVQYDAGAGRKTASFGTMSRRNAETVRGFVSDLEHAARTGTSPRPSTGEWLATLSPALHAKLATGGLCRQRADAIAPAVELGAFLDGYIARRTDLKPGTHVILKRVRKSLVNFFGKRQDVGGISKGEAADWQRHVKETYSQATAHLYAKKARQFFADAADRRLVKENPFRKLKLGTSNNPDRLAYIPASDVLTVIDKTPDPEWKLAFALPRFAAARMPSEVRGLKWSDVAFDARRMTLRSPKTEHHEGRASRVVPIAPELMPLLLAALEAAVEDQKLDVRFRENMRKLESAPGIQNRIPRRKQSGADVGKR